MPNALTRTAGLKIGPIALDTLFKHYFDRVKKERAEDDIPFTQLRQDELLYDEAFSIAKRFFDVASHHTVEELQAFFNARTLSPPSVHVARVIVPMSCCDEAATSVIKALGGEEHASLLVGGTKWWQVRALTGVPGEWVTAKKDWEASRKRRKASKKTNDKDNSLQGAIDTLPPSVSEPGDYDKKADDLRCILYTHGGGYYFGSIDQERYCMQRLARKTKGRVFSVNYRLAPQYPFPCALQDLVAAYLYLIKPPPDAPHQPVKPSHIVVAGSSAGGGLTLALLQVLRDSGQPLPAGGVLISPWCDLTHSFPSIHTNTTTDVLPSYGLCLHKPSTLWPPPTEEMTREIHTGIRQKIRQIVHVSVAGNSETTAPKFTHDALASPKLNASDNDAMTSEMPIDVGATAPLPSIYEKKKPSITLQAKSGEKLNVNSQIQLYTRNELLGHPLVSPALSYLGGLPPLFFIASDKEVLRDEVLYSAHKAAHPSLFPLKDEALALYPPLVGIGERYGPTQVHLQVYDDTAHVLPVLFPFTTPGKYCYRAMATFIKHIAGTLHPTTLSPSSSGEASLPSLYPMNEGLSDSTSIQQLSRALSSEVVIKSPSNLDDLNDAHHTVAPLSDSPNLRPSFSRAVFFSFRAKSTRAPITRSLSDQSLRGGEHSRESQNIGSPGELRRSASVMGAAVRYAGEAGVYYDEEGLLTWKGGMIRERVSTQGIIRPLEPVDQLDALHVPPVIVGVLSERAVRRYLEGKALFDQKYAKEFSAIEKQRNRNIDLAKKDSSKSLTQFQELHSGREAGKQKDTSQAFRDGLEAPTGAWAWACADEHPPPSSIVSRRDTDESRRLARIACRSVFHDDGHMNSNNLWTVVVNLLTTTSSPKIYPASDSEATEPVVGQIAVKKSKSVFASLRIRERPQKD